MNQFENFTPPAGKPEQIHNIDTLKQTQREMIASEGGELLEKAKNASPKVKALIGGLFLTTTMAIGNNAKVEDLSEEVNTSDDFSELFTEVLTATGNEKHFDYFMPDSEIKRALIHYDMNHMWGMEYVPKMADDGHHFLAEKFFVLDKRTGDVSVLGEYNNVVETAEGVSSLEEVPDEVKEFARIGANAVEKVRSQNKELSDLGWSALPDGKHGIDVPGSERIRGGRTIHTEVRKQYEIDKVTPYITVWEIDDLGNEISSVEIKEWSSMYATYNDLIESKKE